jgi:hypothetical protein
MEMIYSALRRGGKYRTEESKGADESTLDGSVVGAVIDSAFLCLMEPWMVQNLGVVSEEAFDGYIYGAMQDGDVLYVEEKAASDEGRMEGAEKRNFDGSERGRL